MGPAFFVTFTDIPQHANPISLSDCIAGLQNRYKSILCQEDSYLLELVRYIHLNPLRAKLVADFKALASYPNALLLACQKLGLSSLTKARCTLLAMSRIG